MNFVKILSLCIHLESSDNAEFKYSNIVYKCHSRFFGERTTRQCSLRLWRRLPIANYFG